MELIVVFLDSTIPTFEQVGPEGYLLILEVFMA